MWDWPRAHGGPFGTGRLRTCPDDFQVDEVLGFEPDGEGEHWLVRVEKRDANTRWVAARLAAFAGVAPSAVSFSGLKDRRALATQWFSVHQPGAAEVVWRDCAVPGARVLEAERHRRKLRRGSHRGNRFRLRVRECTAPPEALRRALETIGNRGVPNYFGDQRFGRGGANLPRALAAFASGRRLGRTRRGFALSGARSWLFNRVLAVRVVLRRWDRPLDGETLALDGSGSVFAEPLNASLRRRVAEGDLHPTGPLPGAGEALVGGDCGRLEAAVLGYYPVLCRGLDAAGLHAGRRALRLPVRDLTWAPVRDGTLELEFQLGRGQFATAVTRELFSA